MNGGPARPLDRGPDTRPAVAITFDDGPSDATDAILARLASAGARATFFVVGERARERPQAVRRIARCGHELGSHAWRHERLERRPLRAFASLVRSSLAIRQVAGGTPSLFRPPYGSWSRSTLAAARLAGLHAVTWSVDPRDWEEHDPALVASRVLDSATAGSIVLLHDHDRGSAVAALGPILDGLGRLGLEPTTVSDLLGPR